MATIQDQNDILATAKHFGCLSIISLLLLILLIVLNEHYGCWKFGITQCNVLLTFFIFSLLSFIITSFFAIGLALHPALDQPPIDLFFEEKKNIPNQIVRIV